jgi:hypothetical protein
MRLCENAEAVEGSPLEGTVGSAGIGVPMASKPLSRVPGWLPHRRLFYDFGKPLRFHTASVMEAAGVEYALGIASWLQPRRHY